MHKQLDPRIEKLETDVESLKREAEIEKRLQEHHKLPSKLEHVEQQLAQLRNEFDQAKKVLVWTSSLLAVLAAFGIFWTVSDVKSYMRSQMDAALSTQTERASILSKGLLYANPQYYRQAIPYLEKALEQNPTDESVINALLTSIRGTELWSDGDSVVNRLLSDGAWLAKSHDPNVRENLAMYLIERSPENEQSLDNARDLLEQALLLSKSDNNSQFNAFLGLFELSMIRDDLDGAKKFLHQALDRVPDLNLPFHWQLTLESVKQLQWFRALQKRRPSANGELDMIWPPGSVGPRDFYSDLCEGLALSDSFRDMEAIPPLRRALQQVPRDEAAIRALAAAADDLGAWSESDTLLTNLLADSNLLNEFQNPRTYCNLGAYFIDRYPDDTNVLGTAHALLESGLKLATDDNDHLWLCWNLFRQAFLGNDLERAKLYLQQTSDIRSRLDPNELSQIDINLETTENTVWFQDLEKRRASVRDELRKMWPKGLGSKRTK